MAGNYNLWQGTQLTNGAVTGYAKKGGAVIRGIFISSKGTSPTIQVYDNSASSTGDIVIPTFVPTGVGWVDFGGIGLGKGLAVKVASCTGTLVWQPASVAA